MSRSASKASENEICVERLRVLADPTRLQVVQELMDGGLHVSELNRRIPIAANLLSHHLRTLREAGLVEAQRDGKSVLYSLAEGVRRGARRPTIDLGCCKISFDEA